MNLQLPVEKLMENLPGILVAFDLDFRIFYVNRMVAGLKRENVIGVGALEFVKEDQRPKAKAIFDQVIQTKKPVLYDVEGYGPNGSTAWYSTQAGPIFDGGELVGVGISSIDVTEQKVQNIAMERKFSELVDAIQGIFWELDPVTQKFVFVSKHAESILGYPLKEWRDFAFWEKAIYPDDRDYAVNFCHSLKNEPHRFEYRMMAKNGKIVWIEDLVNPVLDSQGKAVLLRGLMVDITKRKREELLRQMNAKILDLLISGASLDTVLCQIVEFLESCLPGKVGSVLLVDEKEEVFGDSSSIRLSEEYKKLCNGVRVGPLAGSCGAAVYFRKRIITENMETDPIWENGRSFFLGQGLRACWSDPIFGAEGRILGTFAVYRREPGVPDQDEIELVASVRGLCALAIERKYESDRLEDARLRSISSARIAALGEMAAGMAHEVNNPLAVIVGKVDRLKRMAEEGVLDPKRLHADLKVIESTSNRIAKIVRAMRFLGRNSSDEELNPFLLKNIIDEVLQVAGEMFNSGSIQLKTDLNVIEQVAVRCRPSEIAQIIWNLLKNSYDAILEREEKWISIGAELNSDRVRVLIQDSGTIPDVSVRTKIMQPFFTTKKVGEGVGLGLSLSKSIAENHGGTLSLDDKQKFTTFSLELPVYGA